jgi:hypothetical protein
MYLLQLLPGRREGYFMPYDTSFLKAMASLFLSIYSPVTYGEP